MLIYRVEKPLFVDGLNLRILLVLTDSLELAKGYISATKIAI